jgi:hypothetical protein
MPFCLPYLEPIPGMPLCLPFRQPPRQRQEEEPLLDSEKEPSYEFGNTAQRLEKMKWKEESRQRLVELRTLMQDNKVDY